MQNIDKYMQIDYIIRSALIIMLPKLRGQILNARNRLVPSAVAHEISEHLDIGDWWLIYMLGRNLEGAIYRDILVEMVKDLEVKKKRRL